MRRNRDVAGKIQETALVRICGITHLSELGRNSKSMIRKDRRLPGIDGRAQLPVVAGNAEPASDLHIAGRFSIAGDNRQLSTSVDTGEATILSDHGLGIAPKLTQVGNSAYPNQSCFLDLSGNITIPPHPLRINGNVPGFMFLRSISGSNTWGGDVQVIGAGTIQVTNTFPSGGLGALNIVGGITGVNSGSTAIATSIIKTGSGTLTTKYVRTSG